MSKIVTTSKLNRLWKNGILPIKNKVDSLPTIQTPDTTLTKSGAPADAKATGDKLGTKFDKTKMISSYTDMMANSVSGYGVDALGVKQGFKQVNDSLGGFTPVIDSTGKITGYKTKVGADTVFPFKSGGGENVIRIFGYTYLGESLGSVWIKKGTFEKAIFSLQRMHPTYSVPLSWGVKVTNTPPANYTDTTYNRVDVGIIAKTLAPAEVSLDQYTNYKYIGFEGSATYAAYSEFLIELHGSSDELEVIAKCYGTHSNIFVGIEDYKNVVVNSDNNTVPTCLTKEIIPMATCNGNIRLSEVSSYPANLSLDTYKDSGYRFIGLSNSPLGAAQGGFHRIILSK